MRQLAVQEFADLKLQIATPSWYGGTLDMLAKKRSGVAFEVLASKRGNKLAVTDIAKFNVQYGSIVIK